MRFQLRPGPCAVVATALLLIAGTRPAAAEDRTLTLAVADGGFSPAEIEAPAGGRLRLEVTNGTGTVIEFESFELNRERVVQPGQTVSVYLTGLSAGRYEFFDDFHKERRGVLVVK